MARPIIEDAKTGWLVRIKRLTRIAAAFSLLASIHPAFGQQDARTVRFAFVYNLTKYVTWPQSKRSVLIGFIGDQSTGNAMKQILDGRSSDGRALHVLLNPAESELSGCDIVYFTSAENAKLAPFLPKLGRTPILTIGEDSRFPEHGGMVGLIRSGDQIEIEVNLEALNPSGLKMSSRLLELAVIVSSKETIK